MTPAPDRGDVPLSGGNSNAVVRRGAAVHREAGPWSPTVHAWLRHLRAHGAPFVPEPLGFDADGREVLEFLPGTVPAYPLSAVVRTDAFLVDAARVLRVLHDAGAEFDRAGRVWQQPAREPAEVIAVNDYAPYNLVLEGDRITGVIDLDQASPGPRARDLAHLAYRLVPLTAEGSPDGWPASIDERGQRLGLLVDAYGASSAAAVLGQVEAVLEALAVHAGTPTAIRPALADHVERYRADAAWFRGAAGRLRALTR